MQVSQFKSAHKLITGNGASQKLGQEMHRLNVSKPFIVSDQGVVQSGTLEQITQQFHDSVYFVYGDVPPEPEIPSIARCLQEFSLGEFDSVVAVGGGSAMDSAKALAAAIAHGGDITELFGEDLVKSRTLPLLVLPTTAGTGSEVTNIAILSDPEAQVKKGIVSDCLLPDVAIVSPEMTASCPKSVTAASGIDAFVHALEAYISVNASVMTDTLALKAMSLIFRALPRAYARGSDMAAREDMAAGSLMAGLAFGNAGVGAVHALAYPLGGRFHLSHGMSNAVMLPHVMRWNVIACYERFDDVARAMGIPTRGLSRSSIADKVIDAIDDLCRQVEIPSQLRSFSIPKEDLPVMAEEASKISRLLRNNPRTLSEKDIEKIYQAAF